MNIYGVVCPLGSPVREDREVALLDLSCMRNCINTSPRLAMLQRKSTKIGFRLINNGINIFIVQTRGITDT